MLQEPDAPSGTVAHLARVYFRLSENWIHTQLAHLQRHAPIVLAWETQNLDREGTPPHYTLRDRPRAYQMYERVGRRLLGYFPFMHAAIQAHDARLIHAHFGPLGHFALPLARQTGCALITTFYGYDLSLLPRQEPAWRKRYADLFEGGTRFLVEGGYMRDQLVALGCPPSKTHVQRLGINLDALPCRPRNVSPHQPLRILAAGRFAEKKGFADAVAAFARFRAGGGRGTLTLVGDARPDDEAQRRAKLGILRAIRRHGLEADVALPGMVSYDALVRAYYDHHVFLSPSRTGRDGDNEGGAPVTLIEASATGMPVVSTRHCDIPEVVLHGTTGLLADEGDVEALAGHLARIAREPSLVNVLGRAARAHVAAEYDAVEQGRRLDAIYDDVLHASPAGPRR